MLKQSLAISIFVFLSFTAAWGGVKKPDATNARVESLFRSMRDGSYQLPDAGKWFPNLKWEDIPALLRLGDSKFRPKAYPVNPISSQAEVVAPTEGVIALWLIEGLRKGGKLPSLNALLVNEGKFDRTEAAQTQAYEAYQRWWTNVEKLPVDEARKVEPLGGTKLRWH
jgi:hypothetical protein